MRQNRRTTTKRNKRPRKLPVPLNLVFEDCLEKYLSKLLFEFIIMYIVITKGKFQRGQSRKTVSSSHWSKFLGVLIKGNDCFLQKAALIWTGEIRRVCFSTIKNHSSKVEILFLKCKNKPGEGLEMEAYEFSDWYLFWVLDLGLG